MSPRGWTTTPLPWPPLGLRTWTTEGLASEIASLMLGEPEIGVTGVDALDDAESPESSGPKMLAESAPTRPAARMPAMTMAAILSPLPCGRHRGAFGGRGAPPPPPGGTRGRGPIGGRAFPRSEEPVPGAGAIVGRPCSCAGRSGSLGSEPGCWALRGGKVGRFDGTKRLYRDSGRKALSGA